MPNRERAENMSLFSIFSSNKNAKGTTGRYNVFIGFLIGALLICAVCYICKPDDPTVPQASSTGQNKPRHELEDEAIDLYAKLLKEISTDVASDAQDGTSVTVYPDNYGGAHLGDDGILVVCMTAGRSGRNLLDLDKVFDAADRYTVKTVPYSLNQLKQAHSELRNRKSEYSELYSPDSAEYRLFSSITGFHTDQKANTVHVNMRDVSAEKLRLFEQIFGDSAGMYSIREAGQTIDLVATAG